MKERITAADLVNLRQSLSGRDVAVLEMVKTLRLVGARQVERVHFGDGSLSPLSQARTARRVLERLTNLQLLKRLDRRIGGVRAGSASYIYALGRLGERLLGTDDSRRRSFEPSAYFANHTLAIAEIFVEVVEAQRRGSLELIDIGTEPLNWRSFTSNVGAPGTLKPDLYLSLGVDEYEHLWFVEVDLATEHRPALRRKAEVYLAYLDSGQEQQHSGVFPRVVWSAPNEPAAERIRSALHGLPGPPELFVVTTADRLLRTLMTSN